MPRYLRSVAAAVALPLLVAGNCSNNGYPPPGPDAAQGWDMGKQAAWYISSQGSRMIPESWLTSMEQPDAQAPFLAPDYIASFRYLPMLPGNWASPDGCPLDPRLPLGFAVDCQPDDKFKQTGLRWRANQKDTEPWVGMNCSACHTNQIEYQGQKLLVDGAPTLADFQTFMEKLQLALRKTLGDGDKFTRFATGVLGPAPSANDTAKLRDAMSQLVDWNDRLERLNNAGGLRYGFGRLDAIGHIYNKVALAAAWPTGKAQTLNPADAPVSYPFLWNVPQLNKVEWNGIADNKSLSLIDSFNYGGLGRNTGEVIGVFADIELTSHAETGGYVSSARIDRLSDMENQLGGLYPPAWPAGFPKIDRDLADTGRGLFVSKECSTCHVVPSGNNNLTEKFTVTLNRAFPTAGVKPASRQEEPVNTDMWMACNAVQDSANSGILEGSKTELTNTVVFPPRGPLFTMVQNAVFGALAAQKGQVVFAAAENLFGFAHGLPEATTLAKPNAFGITNLKEARRAACLDPKRTDPAKIVYKGRPLQGIWATAPYLHNGSVPTLYDLLLPPAHRPASFAMGTREFDPVHVGFCTVQGTDNCTAPLPKDSFTFNTVTQAGTPIDGNSNAGHDYGNAALKDPERKALVEYMKTL